MFTLDGKVALITGAARGQGRSHAVTLARAGADIAIGDLCGPLGTEYPDASLEDLEQTKKLVEAEGRRCVSAVVDVRDPDALNDLAARCAHDLGGLDILVANAGILTSRPLAELDSATWQRTIDTNLTGVFNSVKAALPYLLNSRQGRIIAISSMAGRRGYGGIAHYAAAKFGVIGLVKDAAIDLAPLGITVNAVCPTNVGTDMVFNDAVYRSFRPDLPNPTAADVAPLMSQMHPQGIPWVEPQDVSAAVLFLASAEAAHITGEALSVSAGLIAQNSA